MQSLLEQHSPGVHAPPQQTEPTPHCEDAVQVVHALPMQALPPVQSSFEQQVAVPAAFTQVLPQQAKPVPHCPEVVQSWQLSATHA